MRARYWLTLASVPTLFACFIAAAGCGETEEPAKPPSTTDGSADGKSDAASDSKAPPTECLDADITQLNVQDAALGDSGKSIGTCSSCIKTNCLPQLQACQEDCDCRESVLGLFNCVASGKSITTCGGGLVTAGSMAQSLGLCALTSGCAVECGQAGDGGTTNNDAATDAPADSASD